MLSKDQWQAEQERFEEEQDQQLAELGMEYDDWLDLVNKCNDAIDRFEWLVKDGEGRN